MYEVSIEVRANESRYWASLAFEDRAGNLHEKTIVGTGSTKRGNRILAAAAALEELKIPCRVTLYSLYEELNEPIRNGWLKNWAEHDWKNAKGRTVRNMEQWGRLLAAMDQHEITVRYTDGRR